MDPSLLSAASSSTLDGAVVTPYGTLQRAPAELAAFARAQTGSEEDEIGGDDGEMLGIMETGMGPGEGSDDEEDEDEVMAEQLSPPAAKGKGKKRAAPGTAAPKKAKSERDTTTGRRKIRIEFIEDDSRRHITFSKRKAGIMKKAYELATLTGTQVLLLVVSQTGLVYTFTTPKLAKLVKEVPGKELIRSCIASDEEAGDAAQEPEASSLQLGGAQPAQPHVAPKPRAKGGEQMPRETIKNRRATTSNVAAPRMERGGSGNSRASAGSQHDQLSAEAQHAAQQYAMQGGLPLNYNFGSSSASIYGGGSVMAGPSHTQDTQWGLDGSMLPPLAHQQQQQHHMQQPNQAPWAAATLDMGKQHAGPSQAWGRG